MSDCKKLPSGYCTRHGDFSAGCEIESLRTKLKASEAEVERLKAKTVVPTCTFCKVEMERAEKAEAKLYEETTKLMVEYNKIEAEVKRKDAALRRAFDLPHELKGECICGIYIQSDKSEIESICWFHEALAPKTEGEIKRQEEGHE